MSKRLFGLDFLKHYEIYADSYKYEIAPEACKDLMESYEEGTYSETGIAGIEKWNAFELNGVPIFAKYLECAIFQSLDVYFPTKAFAKTSIREWDVLLQGVGLYKRVLPYDTNGVIDLYGDFDRILNGKNMEIKKQKNGYSVLSIKVGLGLSDKPFTYDIKLFDAKVLNDYNKRFVEAFNKASDLVDEKYGNKPETREQAANEMYLIAMKEILTDKEYQELLKIKK